MSTTVPQNIKGCNIMGTHIPTRNSLRHSRMLVGKKNYQGKTVSKIFYSSLILSNFWFVQLICWMKKKTDFSEWFNEFCIFCLHFSCPTSQSIEYSSSKYCEIFIQSSHTRWIGRIVLRTLVVLVGTKHKCTWESILERIDCKLISIVIRIIGNRISLSMIINHLSQLMLSGILGLIVLAFKPRPRQKLRQHFISFLRVNSTFVTFIAAICVFVASSFATLHLSKILSPMAVCRPVYILIDSSACTCRFDGISENESTSGVPKADAEILNGSYYRYIQMHAYAYALRTHTYTHTQFAIES